MAKQWDKLAAKARKIAKNIVTGEEEYKGTRLTAIVYRLDTFATDALNRKYARQGSQASIHTEWGGYQTIDSIHEDGSEGHFDTDGKCESSDNAMDIEIMMYINGGNGGGNNGGSTPSSAPVRRIRESNTRKDMKQNKKTINEAQLRAIVKEAVRNVLKEGIDSQEERINAAVEALMRVREIVSRASDCWEYEDVNAPLFQQICAASSAIEGVMGFSKYGSDIRQQRNLEMSQQD